MKVGYVWLEQGLPYLMLDITFCSSFWKIKNKPNQTWPWLDLTKNILMQRFYNVRPITLGPKSNVKCIWNQSCKMLRIDHNFKGAPNFMTIYS